MSLFGIFGGLSTAERKRNDYFKLRNDLDDYIKKFQKEVTEIESMMSTYKSSLPKLESDKIPSDDFEPKREQKTKELQKYVNYEKSMKAKLDTARRIANEKYEYYKKKAEQEAAEKAAAAAKS